jgi:YbgC/YbaW family acyl-CoA thioester hydrolase
MTSPIDAGTRGAPFILHEYVRWSDVDATRIIRWDAYTRFYELAEAEMYRDLGLSYGALTSRFGITLPRRALHMEFVSPPVLDEHLEVRVSVTQVGTTSMTLSFDVRGNGAALRSAGYMVVVCADANSLPPVKRPWPEGFLRLLAPRMAARPATVEQPQHRPGSG